MGNAFVLEPGGGALLSATSPYRLAARISAGGYSSTYLGFEAGGHAVAVKVYQNGYARDPDVRHRMLGAVGRIDALPPHAARIARIVGSGFDRGRLWFATEYVRGPSLEEFVGEYGPLSREDVRQLARDLARTLGAFHHAGLAGRGLEARDVVLGVDGAVVVDAGITRVEGVGGRVETRQADRSRAEDVAEDVRDLGAVLYLAATGRPASSASSDILSAAVGHCPAALREVIEASQRVKQAMRPHLEAFTAAADTGLLPGASSARPVTGTCLWQSAEVLREIKARDQEVSLTRGRGQGQFGPRTAAAVRDPKVNWHEPNHEASPRNRLWTASVVVQSALRRIGARRRQRDRSVYREW